MRLFCGVYNATKRSSEQCLITLMIHDEGEFVLERTLRQSRLSRLYFSQISLLLKTDRFSVL